MHQQSAKSRARAALQSGALLATALLPLWRHFPAEAPSYLPLVVGRKWVLRSPAVATPIVLEVLAKHADVYDVKFDNPWINSVMSLRLQSGKYVLTGLTMGGHNVPASNDVYYDFSARVGQTWKNHIGTLTLLSRTKSVTTHNHIYTDCVEIEEINSQGNKLNWYFAPGVGYVQFGEGPQAFVLDDAASGKTTAASPATVPASEYSAPSDLTRGSGSGKTWIGVAANPSAKEGYTPRTVQQRFDQSLSAGVSYVYLSPKWNELEPRSGNYQFKDLDFLIAEAERADLPLICNLRVVDTNQRAMSPDLTGKTFRDRKVQDRLKTLISAMLPRMHGRLRYMLIGNEVDSYFKSHPGEVSDYREFYVAGVAAVKAIVPGTPVSVSITFDGLEVADSLLKPLMQQTDFLALTYYPLRPDFTVRDPGDVPSDFSRIVQAAHGRKILLQEVGYPSSPVNGSSEEKQAAMFAALFRELRTHSQDFIGANFLFLSNLSDEVVNGLAQYYSLGNADRFKAYLKTLGMLDDEGRPKKSWKVFQQQAQLMRK